MNIRIKKVKRGFTLLEILLVIAAIGILAAIVLVAINPTRQIAQVRNAQRRSDINTIYKALEQYLIDNKDYPEGITGTPKAICNNTVTPDCVDLEVLVPTYIAAIPKDPSGLVYEVYKNPANNRIGVEAPVVELGQSIAVNPIAIPSATTIVQNGLVLNLDAGNTSSYPGTGTTWTDLSGNGNDSTLVGDEISYLNVNGGVFNFPGIPWPYDTDPDYFSLPNTSFILGANFTIEVWTYYDSASQPKDDPWDGGCLYTNSAEGDWSAGAGNNNGLLFGYNSIVYRNTSGVEIQVDYSPVPTTRVWHQHVLVVNSGTGTVYVDKVQVATLSNMRTYTQSNGTLGIGIADRWAGSYRGEYLGYIPNIKIYTKSFTSEEIQQNYNASKGRFGL